MRSHHACACRLRSSRSVKVTPPHKLFLTWLTLRSTLPFVCGVYALQTRAATAIETMRIGKAGIPTWFVLNHFQQHAFHAIGERDLGQATKVFKCLPQPADERRG